MFRLRTLRTTQPTVTSFIRSFAAPSTAGGLNLSIYGINPAPGTKVHRNLSYDEIYQHELASGVGTTVKNGTYAVDTGKFTGRSPKDKYIVEKKPSADNIWWGPVNRPMKEAVFDRLHGKIANHFSTNAKNIYVFDGYSGVNLDTRKKVVGVISVFLTSYLGSFYHRNCLATSFRHKHVPSSQGCLRN